MELEQTWLEMNEAFKTRGEDVEFRPGRSADEVRSRLADTWATPTDELVRWFTLQDGLSGNCTELFYGFAPLSLDDLVTRLWKFLSMMSNINAESDGELTNLDIFPKPGWFLLDDGDGKFVVDTETGPQGSSVSRRWARDIEPYANSISDFLKDGTRRYLSGDEILSFRASAS